MLFSEVNEDETSRLPVGRWVKIKEIGALACYLCSDAAGFITGTDVVIDSGWTAKQGFYEVWRCHAQPHHARRAWQRTDLLSYDHCRV
jgi:hypothetical protein